MVYGIDASLTRFALVLVDDDCSFIYKSVHTKTGLSLQSEIQEILITAKELYNKFYSQPGVVYLDLSKAQGAYPGGKIQKWLTGIFLGALASHFDAVPISQNEVRVAVGIPIGKSKQEVHTAFGVERFANTLYTDDLRDAYIVASAGYKLKK